MTIKTFSIIEDYQFSNQEMRSSIESVLKCLEQSQEVQNTDLKVLKYTIKIFRALKLDFFDEERYQLLIQKTKLALEKPVTQSQLGKLKKIQNILTNSDDDSSDGDEWILLESPQKQPTLATKCSQNAPLPSPAAPSSAIIREKPHQGLLNAITSPVGGGFVICSPNTNGEDEASSLEFVLREKEKLLISEFGHALFADYLPTTVQYFKESLFDLLKEDYLKCQIRELLETNVNVAPSSPNTTKNSEQNHLQWSFQTNLLNITLITQTKCTIEGLRSVITKILAEPQLRTEFPFLIFRAVPKHLLQDMSPEAFQLVSFFVQSFLPDILDAVLKRVHLILEDEEQTKKLEEHLSKYLGKQREDIDVDVVELVAYLILNHILEPSEAGFEVFLTKINEEKLSVELKSLLNNLLIDSFFNQPEVLKSRQKKLFVSLLNSVQEFFTLFNKVKSVRDANSVATLNLEADYAQMMLQNFVQRGIIKPNEQNTTLDWVDFNIRLLIQEIFWCLFFPGKGKKDPKASLTIKLVITLVSAYCQRLCSQLLSQNTLNILIDQLIQQPLAVDNPFERRMPADIFFDLNDSDFSTRVDLHLRSIISEVFNVCASGPFLKTLKDKFLSWVPEMGKLVGQKLNKISNSTSTILPILILIQFLYKVNASNPIDLSKAKGSKDAALIRTHAIQQLYFDTLNKSQRKPLLTDLFKRGGVVQQQINERVTASILGNKTQLVEDLIKDSVPFGFRDFAFGSLKTFYKIFKEDYILKELLIIILHGLHTTLAEVGGDKIIAKQ